MKNFFSPVKRLYLASFFRGLFFYVPIFTLFMMGHGVTLASIIIAETCYSLFSLISEIPTGVFADKFGAKNSVIIGNIIEAVGIGALIFFPTALTLFVTYALRGFGSSFISGAEESWIYQLSKEEHASFVKVSANIQTINLVGGSLAALVTGLLVQLYGASSYGWLIALTVVCVLVSQLVVMSIRHSIIHVPEEQGSVIDEIIKPTIHFFKTDLVIRAFILTTLLSINTQFFLSNSYQQVFDVRSVPAVWLGLAFAIASVVNAFMSQFWVYLNKWFSYAQLYLVYGLVIGFGYVVFASIKIPVISVFIYILVSGFFDTIYPITSDFANKYIQDGVRATVLSAISFISSGAQMLLRIGIGFFVGVFSLKIAFILVGLYVAIGALVGFEILKRSTIENVFNKNHS